MQVWSDEAECVSRFRWYVDGTLARFGCKMIHGV